MSTFSIASDKKGINASFEHMPFLLLLFRADGSQNYKDCWMDFGSNYFNRQL